MTDRVIEISDAPARLRLDTGRLVIERPERTPFSLPLDEIAALVLAHPQISLTQPLLAALGRAGASVIACDRQSLPAAMMLPVATHSTQAEKMAAQASASLPLRKALWRQIVIEKVRAQGRLLMELRGKDLGLARLATQVRSGDTGNIEAQASARYWKALFARDDFRRSRDAEDENRFLNYGYAILRASVARAICAAGMHPSLGLHHHNRYDAFRLADDLMEPFRPMVDRAVVHLTAELGATAQFDAEVKRRVLGALTKRYEVGGERRTLADLAQRAAFSLAAVFEGRRKKLDLEVP